MKNRSKTGASRTRIEQEWFIPACIPSRGCPYPSFQNNTFRVNSWVDSDVCPRGEIQRWGNGVGRLEVARAVEKSGQRLGAVGSLMAWPPSPASTGPPTQTMAESGALQGSARRRSRALRGGMRKRPGGATARRRSRAWLAGGHDGRWCRHEVGSGLWSGGWRPAMGTGGPHRQPEFPSRPAAAGEGGEVALLPAGRRRADGDRMSACVHGPALGSKGGQWAVVTVELKKAIFTSFHSTNNIHFSIKKKHGRLDVQKNKAVSLQLWLMEGSSRV